MDRGRYVQQDVNRYWFSTKPNLNRTAHDRAADYLKQKEELHAELIRRLEQDRTTGEFSGIHICPHTSADVPDDPMTRLVILRPDVPHKRKKEDTPARKTAEAFLNSRGNSPRINRNTLLFLAADDKELEALEQAVSVYLSWRSIPNDKVTLDLTYSQQGQVEQKLADAESTLITRLNNTWQWALVPYQGDPAGKVEWEEHKVTGGGGLGPRTANKMKNVERLYPSIGGVILKMKALDILWKDRDHVTVGELSDWLPKYLYLPRVKNREAIVKAVETSGDLFASDTWATAEAYDEEKGRYRGLRLSGSPPSVDNHTCLVKDDIARAQLEAETPGSVAPGPSGHPGTTDRPKSDVGPESKPPPSVGPKKPTAFVGSVKLDPLRIAKEAGKISEEILANLEDLPGAEIELTLEIHARVPGGVSDDIVRVVSENATVLKFDHASFEGD